MQKVKEAIITFKVDSSLSEAMKGVPNRSEFLRSAVLAPLESACPFCKRNGVMNPNQKRHWDDFSTSHHLQECGDCHEIILVCSSQDLEV